MTIDAVANWFGIISFPMTVFALWQVYSFRRLLRSRAIDSRVHATFEKLNKLRVGQTFTPAWRTDSTTLLKDLRDFYISKIPCVDGEVKTLVERVQKNLLEGPDIRQLKQDLDALQKLIFSSSRI